MKFIVLKKEDLLEVIREEYLKLLNSEEKTPQIEKEELLDKKQAAHILQCSVSSIDNFRRKGILKGIKIGSSVRFYKSELIKSFSN